MEFPPESYDVFDSELFETARARLAGDAVLEVMLQMRPNGRCLDHYRIALDGTVLETQVNATSVFHAPVLAKYRLTYQAWPRDLKIRRNMTTTAWVDSFLAIAANNIMVSTEEKGDAVTPEDIKGVFASIIDAQPGAFEDHPGVMEARPGAIEDRYGALEAHHGAVEACPGALESLSRDSNGINISSYGSLWNHWEPSR
jgi:hypothetical protein